MKGFTLVRRERNDAMEHFDFVRTRPLSTAEASVTIDYSTKTVHGTCVAYGEWFDLERSDCLTLLKQCDDDDVLRQLRDFL